MLPFLKNKNQQSIAGIIMKTRTPDESAEPKEESNDPAAAMEACATDLINAVHSRDAKAVAQCLKDAFEVYESMPHDESTETDEAY